MKVRRVKTLIVVLLCTVMMIGCGGKGSKGRDEATKTIVDAAQKELGLTELSTDEMKNYYESATEAGWELYRDKVGFQDEDIVKLRTEKGSLPQWRDVAQIIMFYKGTSEGNLSITVEKIDQHTAQETFEATKQSISEVYYADDKIFIYNAREEHCSFFINYDEKHVISGTVGWKHVDGTNELAEESKKFSAFFDVIGVSNPITILDDLWTN